MSRYANLYPAPNEMQLGVIRAAWPTAAWQNKATALTANWMFARGTPLVVDAGHWWPGGGAQTQTLHYRYQVDDVHNNLAIALTCSMQPAFGSSASSLPVTIGGYALAVGTEPRIIQIPYLNLGGNAEASLALVFEWDGDVGTMNVHNIHVYECPAVTIANTGVEVIERGDMIWDGYDDRQSIAGLERAVNDLRDNYFRKGALYNWANGSGITTTETSYQDLHSHGIRPAIQTRMMYENETLRDVACNVYASVTGGTGNVRLTMTNGDVRTFAITNTSPDWQTTESLQVETEDPAFWSVNGGVRGGSRDELTIEYRAGAGESIALYGVSIWDPPGD